MYTGQVKLFSIFQENPGSKEARTVEIKTGSFRKQRSAALEDILVELEAGLAEDGTALPSQQVLKLCLPEELEEAGLLPACVDLGTGREYADKQRCGTLQ